MALGAKRIQTHGNANVESALFMELGLGKGSNRK